jgi:hypothetical protein
MPAAHLVVMLDFINPAGGDFPVPEDGLEERTDLFPLRRAAEPDQQNGIDGAAHPRPLIS